jgi:hypothetical protein
VRPLKKSLNEVLILNIFECFVVKLNLKMHDTLGMAQKSFISKVERRVKQQGNHYDKSGLV